jgi:hypothetical protein
VTVLRSRELPTAVADTDGGLTPARPGALGPWFPASLLALAAANLAVTVGPASPVRAVVVLPVLLVLPGHLAMRAAGFRRPAGWDALLHTVALSLLILIATSFVLAVRPGGGGLTAAGGQWGFDAVVLLLLCAAVHRDRRAGVALLPRAPDRTVSPLRTVPLAVLAGAVTAAVAVGLAVAGALRLNEGGGPGPTEAAFAVAAAALAVTTLGAPGHPRNPATEQVVATTVYLLAATVLLATSLRGAGVTGHDIKVEYRVLADTLERGAWRPGGLFAAYNSCLSITTLPAFLSRVLGIAPLDVFRVVFQLVFAVVPVAVYLIARRVLPVGGAALAAGLFIAFPTFVNDMSMLNRQEIGLVFLAMATLTVLDTRDSRRARRAILVAMVAGLTVSHYSSAYLAAGTLAIACALLALRRMTWRWHTKPITGTATSVLSLPVVALAIALPLLWGATTGSGGGLIGTVSDTLAAVQARASASSDAVGYWVFSPRPPRPTDRQALREYTLTSGDRPSSATLDALQRTCPTHLVPADTLPGTAAGRALDRAGIAPETVNTWSRRGTVLLFEVGGALAALSAWVRSRLSRGPDGVLGALAVSATAVLTATVLLPQLSLSYGLLRVYQQALLVLAPVIVLGLVTALQAIGRAGRVLSTVLVTGTLVITSGLLPQLIGGYPPQLDLNNAGPYYRAYYASAADLATARWVREHLPADVSISADSAATATLRSTTGTYPLEGVAPGTVPADAHLVLTVRPGGRTAEAVAVSGDRILVYTFPSACVTRGRPLLHSSAGHRVYGPSA